MRSTYTVVRALAISVNAVATQWNSFARHWSQWHQSQSVDYGLLLLSTTLALMALAWPERYRGVQVVFKSYPQN
jgi:hypothetical protein